MTKKTRFIVLIILTVLLVLSIINLIGSCGGTVSPISTSTTKTTTTTGGTTTTCLGCTTTATTTTVAGCQTVLKATIDVGIGNSLYVTGGLTELGSWSCSGAVAGSWTTGNVWLFTVSIPSGTTFSYKYIKKVGSTGYWQNDPNNSGTSCTTNDNGTITMSANPCSM